MNGIEKITARIEAAAQAEVDRILAEAGAEAAEIAAKFQAQADAEGAELAAKNAAEQMNGRLGCEISAISLTRTRICRFVCSNKFES